MEGYQTDLHRKLTYAIAAARKIQQREVDPVKGLNFRHMTKISGRMTAWMKVLADGLADKIANFAGRQDSLGAARVMRQGRSRKKAQDEENEKRKYTLFRSSIVKIIPNVDMDKKYFLEEFLKLLSYADMYFKQFEYVAFYNTGLALSFCAIQTKQQVIANKVYSLFGQMLLTAKQYGLALDCYSKLQNLAHTNRDIITKAYALRQMSHCFMKMEKHENAVICLKYVLGISWTIKLTQLELSSYESMAVAYLYLGKIEKVRYYDARVMHGMYESDKSQIYKITVSQTIAANTWLRETTSQAKQK